MYVFIYLFICLFTFLDPMKKANQQAVINNFSPMSVVPACEIEGLKAFKHQ